MASSVSRFNTGRLLVVGIFEISRVSIRSIYPYLSILSELKDAIRREVSSIHPDVLHSTVAGFVTRLWNIFSPVVVVMWCNKVVKVFCSLCMHCFFDLRTSAPPTG
ncbi:hypothetical protein TNCV_423011 [Trichonephila clavipes]|nr:hypothetical protein TNCV_423011 [Trichonephila clavipes]